jgi:hypothetical protein
MDQHDRDAMRRAIEMLRADPDYREQLEQMLRTQPWEEAGLFAAKSRSVQPSQRRTKMTTPLALTDAQISAIMALSRPLSPDQRSRFLEMLAAKLDGRRELGDGQLYRLCRELQREYFSPPDFNVDSGGKWNGRAVRSARSRRDDDGEDDKPHKRLQLRSLGTL